MTALSVGVPTYNQADFLGKTLDSLLDQTEPPLEIVVSENHSTDDTPRVLERFAGRVRVVRPDEHLSMAANWNFCVSQTRGEWVALLSSDDLARPNYVATLSRGGAGTVLVRGEVERIDQSDRFRGDSPYHGPRVAPYPENLREQLYFTKTHFGAAAWRREAWEAVGGFPEEFALAADWAFWLRLAPHGAFKNEPERVLRYRETHREKEQDARRVPAWFDDTARLYREVMPPLTRDAGIPDEELRRGARWACYAQLHRASLVVPAGERRAATDRIRAWAAECGLDDALARFERGDRLPRKNYGKLRMLMSNISHGLKRLRHRLAGGS